MTTEPTVEYTLDLHPGDRVTLTTAPPYFKTADPMPMLRPPDLIPVGEIGTVIEVRPSSTWSVKFPQGVLLLDEKYLSLAPPSSPDGASG